MLNALQFLPVPPDESLIYAASYSPLWVTVSILIAVLASYAALKASTRIAHAQETFLRIVWIFIGSFVLGVGTWAMHFIGMLALSLPCGIHYDPAITLISMIPGILAAGIAFGVVWHHGKKHLHPLLASILFGAGIGTMHYTGMAAMHLDGFIRYNPALFALSILTAIALSYLALQAKDKAEATKQSMASVAVILGGAVSAMHYTAMTATYFMRGEADTERVYFSPDTLALLVAITTMILALAALSLAAFSRNREITEQLRESEERLHFALESAEDGVWDWNPLTDEAMFSRRWKEMIGYAVHEFPDTGAAWLEHMHPKDRERVVAAMQDYFSGKAPLYVVEFRMRCKDGSWKWILARGKTISRDVDGAPLRMIGTHTDISERKRAEIALMQSQADLQTAQRIARVGSWQLDLATNRVVWSEELFRMQGLDPESTTPPDYTESEKLFTPDSWERLSSSIARAAESGIPYELELEMVKPDGSHGWMQARGEAVRDESNDIIVGVRGVAVDITERKQSELALQESHQKLHSLLNSMAEGAYGVDINGNCTFVNRSFLTLLGYEHPDEIVGKHIHEVIHHSHADGTPYPAMECRMYNAYRLNQEVHVDDEVFWKKKGTPIAVEYWSQPIIVGGVIQGAVATFVDITERKQIVADLRESEKRFRQMFERHSAVMLLIEPESGMIVDANPAAAQFYGYPLQVLRGKSIASVNTQPEEEIVRERQAAIAQERNYFVFDHRLAGGEVRTVEVYSSPVSYKGRPLLFSIIHDITDRKLAEAQIHNLAFYDALTQLPNRRLLYDRLDQVIAASRRSSHYGALMFMDLDNFKPLNDTHGHEVGDLLLIEVSRRIEGCVRETDTAARFGGDEFVVMLGDLDEDVTESEKQALAVAEKIRAKLSEPYHLTTSQGTGDLLEHRCSSSIGVVMFRHPANREALLRETDEAMYKAKDAGRNCVVVGRYYGHGDAERGTSILRLEWHESYGCGEATIDEEHHKLFDLANALIESAFTRDADPKRFDDNLERLLAHIVQHFADEEAILESHHYTDLAVHRHAHLILVEHAMQLKKRIESESISIGELVNFLADEVVAKHMLKTDRQFYSLFEKNSISHAD